MTYPLKDASNAVYGPGNEDTGIATKKFCQKLFSYNEMQFKCKFSIPSKAVNLIWHLHSK